MFYLAVLLNALDAFWLISSTRISCLCPHLTSVIFQSTLKAAALSDCSSHHRAGTLSTKMLLYNQASFPKNQQEQEPEVMTGGCMSAPDPRFQGELLFLSTASTNTGRHQPSASLSLRNLQPAPEQLHVWI